MKREVHTQSESKKQLLNEQIECFKRLISACEEIRDGHSETYVCEKYNISRRQFRSIIFDDKLGFDFKAIDLPPTDEGDSNYRKYWFERWDDYCWEEKLFCVIFNEYDIRNVPANIEKSIPLAMESLSESERDVLLYRFRDGLSFSAISEILNLTNERIRWIESKALRKMRHPSRSNILIYGADILDIDKERKRRTEVMLNSYKENVEKALESAEKATLLDMRRSIDKKLKEIDPDEKVEVDITIESLGLSVRTYNCCRRGGYRYINDFRGKTVNEILNIRNFGRKSFEELVSALEQSGIELKEDENPYAN